MDTRDYTHKAPYLQDDECDVEQVTIDAWYYSDLQKIKNLTKSYFKLVDYPLDLTSDEVQKLTEIRKKLKKIL